VEPEALAFIKGHLQPKEDCRRRLSRRPWLLIETGIAKDRKMDVL